MRKGCNPDLRKVVDTPKDKENGDSQAQSGESKTRFVNRFVGTRHCLAQT